MASLLAKEAHLRLWQLLPSLFLQAGSGLVPCRSVLAPGKHSEGVTPSVSLLDLPVPTQVPAKGKFVPPHLETCDSLSLQVTSPGEVSASPGTVGRECSEGSVASLAGWLWLLVGRVPRCVGEVVFGLFSPVLG